ncbi:MAG: DUF2855 family protein, partial [Xanthomonadaceae bacterium]|nr:DUF2855 family protein [Xanthomonadaceae bacterium]
PEPLHAIFRPLFVTAFCLADFLAANHFFGASQLLFSSASSKTAYATAFCLRRQSDINSIALTSHENREFVKSSGLYEDALSYDELERLDPAVSTVYVDIAGNSGLQHKVHQRFGPNLAYDCSVGAAQSLVPPRPDRQMSGPRPEFFFAPDWIEKRHKDWGVGAFNERVTEATIAFYRHLSDKHLLEISEGRGLDAAKDILGDMLKGRTEPVRGHVIRP